MNGDVSNGVIKAADYNSQQAKKWEPEEFESRFHPDPSLKGFKFVFDTLLEFNRRLKNVEEFLKMEFGDKYNK